MQFVDINHSTQDPRKPLGEPPVNQNLSLFEGKNSILNFALSPLHAEFEARKKGSAAVIISPATRAIFFFRSLL